MSDEALWTLDNLRDLHQRFTDNPLEGARDFIDKLQEQLDGAPGPVVRLAAEALWFLFLFPSQRLMKAETKRDLIGRVWGWSGALVPDSVFLDDAHLHGVGHPGTAYNTHRPAEFGYLLKTVAAFKALPPAEQAALVQENVPWGFMEWLDQQDGSARRLVRNTLLYFLFPDHLERNASRDHRAQIYDALKDKLPAEHRIRNRQPSLMDLDKAIAEIRDVLAAERGTPDLDFYQDDIKTQWFSRFQKGKLRNFRSWMDRYLADHGLKFNTSGRDTSVEKLREEGAIDPATGFWAKDKGLTAKPPRWLIHFDLTQQPGALVPEEHRSRVIGFANTKGGDSGAFAVRIMPVIKIGDGAFQPIETWEWLLLFCFPGGLPPGSAAQAFDDFDPATGTLTYMGSKIPYIFSALLCLNGEEETYSAKVGGVLRTLSYGDATRMLSELVHTRSPEAAGD